MLTFPPDFSFVIQIASFLILWFGLKRLLFDPVLGVLEERDARTTGARQAAAEMTATAQRSQTEYERRMHELRVTLSAEAQAAHKAIQEEEHHILADTRQQASTQLMQLRDSLRRQAEAARPALLSEAKEIAGEIVERVVGRPS